MARLVTTIILLLGLLESCTYQNMADVDFDNDLVIKTGKICGWCWGYDSLTITNDRISYDYFPACGNKGNKIVSPISQEEWEAVKELLNFEKFINININTCNVCADGCDQWIFIRNGSSIHEIRFGHASDSAVAPIRPFIEKLNAIRKRFKTASSP